MREWRDIRALRQTRMKLSGDSGEHWHESWRDLSTHLPWQPVVRTAATTTQRVSLCITPWPRHRPPSRRRIANDWHSTHTSAPFVSRPGQSAATASTSFLRLPTDDLEQDRRTSVSSNCMQYLRIHATHERNCGCNLQISHWPCNCVCRLSNFWHLCFQRSRDQLSRLHKQKDILTHSQLRLTSWGS